MCLKISRPKGAEAREAVVADLEAAGLMVEIRGRDIDLAHKRPLEDAHRADAEWISGSSR